MKFKIKFIRNLIFFTIVIFIIVIIVYQYSINTSISDTGDDVAFENYKFDPANKDLWLAAYFIPATTEAMGKTDASGDEQRGIFQISVFIALGNVFDETQLTKEELRKQYYPFFEKPVIRRVERIKNDKTN